MRPSAAAMAMPEYPALTAWLVVHGYAVLIPERPGHGATGGPFLESEGWCLSPHYIEAGRAIAQTIDAAIGFMRGQSFVRKDHILVIGNSAGGWGGLAVASENEPFIAGVVNFSGGLGGREKHKPDNNCAPDQLVAAAAAFGRTARTPSLWLYSSNDTFFAPHLSQAMAAAYRGAGGRIDYALLPPVRGDGHALISTSGNEASWQPQLSRFLAGL